MSNLRDQYNVSTHMDGGSEYLEVTAWGTDDNWHSLRYCIDDGEFGNDIGQVYRILLYFLHCHSQGVKYGAVRAEPEEDSVDMMVPQYSTGDEMLRCLCVAAMSYRLPEPHELPSDIPHYPDPLSGSKALLVVVQSH